MVFDPNKQTKGDGRLCDNCAALLQRKLEDEKKILSEAFWEHSGIEERLFYEVLNRIEPIMSVPFFGDLIRPSIQVIRETRTIIFEITSRVRLLIRVETLRDDPKHSTEE
jgi:hypothetical protein